MAPTGVVTDDDDVEQVQFLRDDMAAMAWAMEHRLQGDLDLFVDAHERYLDRLSTTRLHLRLTRPAARRSSIRSNLPARQLDSDGSGALPARRIVPPPRHDGDSHRDGLFDKIKARAARARTRASLLVADRIVSRSGIMVRRYFRYTRSSDGTIFLWSARQSEQGRGTGWSGLRFDLVRDLEPTPNA